MFIAKNLKRMRIDMGWPQEEFATHVGVSGQAVSKWERDESYPDITLLPGLPHCFGVTVDELLGMGEIKGKMWGVYEQGNALNAEGRHRDAAVIFEGALKDFPADLGLAEARAEALAMAGEGIGGAILACERMLEKGAGEKRRATTTAVLCFLYDSTGEREKAEALARNCPHARESRELLLPNFLPPAEREAYLRKHLPGILAAICELIDGRADTLEEKLRQIVLGAYEEPIAVEAAILKIDAFLSEK